MMNGEPVRQCLSPTVYAAIENSAARALDDTPRASNDLTFTIFALALFLGVGLWLALAGECFVRTTLGTVTVIGTFMLTLYVSDWLLASSAGTPPDGFVPCYLPLLLSIGMAVLTTSCAMCLVDALQSISFFLFGATAGVVAMLLLRSAIISAYPEVADAPAFRFYILSVCAVGAVAGLVGICLRTAVVLICSVALGSYLVAGSTLGLLLLGGAPGVAAWWFWLLFLVTACLGLAVQVGCLRPRYGRHAKGEGHYAE